MTLEIEFCLSSFQLTAPEIKFCRVSFQLTTFENKFYLVLQRHISFNLQHPKLNLAVSQHYDTLIQLTAFEIKLCLLSILRSPIRLSYGKLSEASENIGLEVNEKKTKYLVTSSSNSRPPVQTLQLGGKTFERVDSFIYLGSQVNSDNSIGEEIRWRVTLGTISMYELYQS